MVEVMFKSGNKVCLNYNLIGRVDTRIGTVVSTRMGVQNEKVMVSFPVLTSDEEYNEATFDVGEWNAEWLLLV